MKTVKTYIRIQDGVEYHIASDIERTEEELGNRVNRHLEMRAKLPGNKNKTPRPGDIVFLEFRLDLEQELEEWLNKTSEVAPPDIGSEG
jgi:hypothetical protein